MSNEPKTVHIELLRDNHGPSNEIKTSKYSLLTFLPLSLFEQMRKVSNMYFLLVMAFTLVPRVSVISPLSATVPLIFVLGVAILKEAYEDVKRHRSDATANAIKVLCYQAKTQTFESVASRSLQVGSIVKYFHGEEIRADSLVLTSSLPDGIAYIETANLDGETNAKTRRAATATIDLFQNEMDIARVCLSTSTTNRTSTTAASSSSVSPSNSTHGGLRSNSPTATPVHHQNSRRGSSRAVSSNDVEGGGGGGGGVKIEACLPNPDLSNWYGTMETPEGKIPLGIDQFIPRGCVLRNTEWVICAAVHTGKETKMMLNLNIKPNKLSVMETRLNHINLFLFLANQMVNVLFCGLSVLWTQNGINGGKWYIDYDLKYYSSVQLFFWRYLTFFVIISYLIPISLYVTLEFVKAVQILFIAGDEKMAVVYPNGEVKYPRPKTSNLNVQLAHVRYVFTDKTGTLTENSMKYVGGFVAGKRYDTVQEPDALGRDALKILLPQQHRNQPHSVLTSPLASPLGQQQQQQQQSVPVLNPEVPVKELMVPVDPARLTQLSDLPLFRYLLSLALCNNVVAFSKQSESAHSRQASMDAMSLSRSAMLANAPEATAAGESHHTRQPTRVGSLDLNASLRHHHHHHSTRSIGGMSGLPNFHSRVPSTLLEMSLRRAASNVHLGHEELRHRKPLVRTFESQSLDEVALVQAAATNGFTMKKRTARAITLDIFGNEAVYEIFAELDFTPQRKLMSIIIRPAQHATTTRLAQIVNRGGGGTAVAGGAAAAAAAGEGSLIFPSLAHSLSPILSSHNHHHNNPPNHHVSVPVSNHHHPLPRQFPAVLPVTLVASPSRSHMHVDSNTHSTSIAISGEHGGEGGREGDSGGGGGGGEPLDQTSAYHTPLQSNSISVAHVTSSFMSTKQQPPEDEYLLLVKGADTSIINILADRSEVQSSGVHEALEDMARDGLRTLLLAYRPVSQAELDQWLPVWEQARCAMDDRSDRLHEAYAMMEKEVRLIGSTAVEDKLQEGVPETLDMLLRADIVVWMLTGDKRETAVTIAATSGLVHPQRDQVLHLDIGGGEGVVGSKAPLSEQLRQLRAACDASPTSRVVMVIDGATLAHILQDDKLVQEFFEIGSKCRSAVCCRMTPLQKATIVKLFQENTSGVALAIGDGANDVSMLQESRIGIGIMGVEGSQAELASDFAIPKFFCLQRLLFVHGRHALYRESHCILFSIYKNLVLTLSLMLFNQFNGFTGSVMFDSWLLSMFNLFFLGGPPLALGMFDKDADDELLESHPQLYPTLCREDMFCGIRSLLGWFCEGVCHGCFLFFVVMATVTQDDVHPWRNSPMEAGGTLLMILIVVVCNLQAILAITSWNAMTIVLTLLSIAITPILLMVYSTFRIFGGANWMVDVPMNVFRSSRLWMLLPLTVGALVVWQSMVFLLNQLLWGERNVEKARRCAKEAWEAARREEPQTPLTTAGPQQR